MDPVWASTPSMKKGRDQRPFAPVERLVKAALTSRDQQVR